MFNFGKRKSCTHSWRTVAIDTSISWCFLIKPDDNIPHVLLYQVCERCQARQMDYDDATDDGVKYARAGNTSVATLRSKWIHANIIRPPKNPNNIIYVDPNYAPLRGFENWLKALQRDPEMKSMLQQQMVDDALGQLEVAIKLYVNNLPQDKE